MSRLPRIACFHGGGSNAAVYETQCSQLEGLRKKDFKLVFFEAPFTRDAGHGVLPAFRDYEPFRSWFARDESGAELSDGSGYDRIGRDGVERVWGMMEADTSSAGEWVGVMGFSQGTRITSGLLLDQQRRKALGEPLRIELKFGVICMGGNAPMQSEVSHSVSGLNEQVSIRTVHVHGLKDPFLLLSRHQLETLFDASSTNLLEIDYHHAMPWIRDEVQALADRIRKTYIESMDFRCHS